MSLTQLPCDAWLGSEMLFLWQYCTNDLKKKKKLFEPFAAQYKYKP